MKALTMSDLRKKGEIPLSPKDRHSLNVGSGNYNRFAPLMPPPTKRGRINSKRKFDDDPTDIAPKTPRLDANVVFSQLKGSEDAVAEIRQTFADAFKVGESCYSANDGAMGEAFFKLAKAVDLLIDNQEKILSTVVDAMGMIDKSSRSTSYAAAASSKGNRAHTRDSQQPAYEDNPDEVKTKKLRQAIAKAEKSVTLFDLDLGPVPVLNRETLSRKVTILLHDRAKREGVYKGNPSAAEEAMDDILSCASIDILGKGSQPFFNKKDTSDPRNGKMCTVPIKLTFKELSLKKMCKVKCGTPYPKKLRSIMDTIVKDCKAIRTGTFILAKVDSEKLVVTAKARSDKGWEDLDVSVPIPSDTLDPAEMAAAMDEEVSDVNNIS
jgi:hypothetical protein